MSDHTMSEERDLLATRRAKREKWLESAGSYTNDFRREHVAADLHAKFATVDKAELATLQVPTAISGRVMLRRVMGKASFITVADVSGQIQCYLSKGELGESAMRILVMVCSPSI